MANTLEQRNSIRVALIGCVSSGKSTLLNSICVNEYEDMKRKRTTMLPSVYKGSNTAIHKNQTEINTCAHLQQRIGWGHFIRGRISTSFHNPINNYYRQNHLGKRYTSSFWFRSIITFLWDLHHHAWTNYCNTIHNPDKTIRTLTTAKSTLILLVDKYILEAKILPNHKMLFFACKKMQYQSWSITELQNWLSSARRILRRYRARIVDAPNHTTSTLPSEHIVHCPPNTNHYIASPITNYYKKKTFHSFQ